MVIALVIWWSGKGGEIESSSPSDLQVKARVEQTPEAGAVSSSAISDLRGLPPAAKLVAIQVASFRTQGKAERVLAQARERTGLSGMVLPTEVDGVRWHRIILGAFLTSEDATQAAEPLLREGMITEVLVWPIPSRWVSVLTGQEAS
jgi:septal ring-binding cell division protein DamX